MRLKPVCGVMSSHQGFVMRRKLLDGDREVCGLNTPRRWLGEIPNGYRHARRNKPYSDERANRNGDNA